MTEQTEKPKKSESTSISGSEIILLFLFGPIVLVWLGLGARIIWAASADRAMVSEMEPLLLGLS